MNLIPLNPTVSVSGIYLATARGDEFAGRAWGNSQYEDFCYGPQFIGQQEYQYKTEWYIKIDKKQSNLFSNTSFNSKEKLKQYNDSLILSQFSDVDFISLEFDEIGLPCVAFQKSGLCNIRRLVNGVLFKYQFSGKNPSLLSNNTLQPDTSVRDIACFYIDTGILKYRIQRDNFTIAYQPYSGSILKLDSIYKVISDKANFRYSIYARGLDGLDYKLDSLNYPTSPIYEFDTGQTSFSIFSGLLFDIVSDIGTFGEQPNSRVEMGAFSINGGNYKLILNDIGTFGERSNSRVEMGTFSINGGGYKLILNDIGTFGEQPNSKIELGAFSINGGGYNQVAFPFTYQETGTISFSLVSGKLV